MSEEGKELLCHEFTIGATAIWEMLSEPRKEVWDLIGKNNLVELLKRAGTLHGHFCPGLALGIRAGTEMVRRLNARHRGMEDVIAIVETNNCFSDGIQFTTGCTFGNNALVFSDYGKTAATLANRSGQGVRACINPQASEVWDAESKQSEGEEPLPDSFPNQSAKKSYMVITADVDRLFSFHEAQPKLPGYARIHESVICENCGEMFMTTRSVKKRGKTCCIPCARESYYQLTGGGIERKGWNEV